MSARTSSTSSSSFFRIKNSYRKTSTSSSTNTATTSGASSASESHDDNTDTEEDEEEDNNSGGRGSGHDLSNNGSGGAFSDNFSDLCINESPLDEANIEKIRGKSEPVHITLKLQVTESTFSVWETVRRREGVCNSEASN